MAPRIFSRSNLKWSVGLVLLLFLAACGTSASPGPGDQAPSPLPQVIGIDDGPSPVGESRIDKGLTETAPLSATGSPNPSPNVPLTDTSIDPKTVVEIEPTIVEATPDPANLAHQSVTPTELPLQPTQALAPKVQPTPTLAGVAAPSVVSLPTPTVLVQPEPVLKKSVAAEPGVEQSAAAVAPVPTAEPTTVKTAKSPAEAPTAIAIVDVGAAANSGETTGGARRFTLPSAQGGQVSLEDYLKRGNVVLVFYRAFW